jgi:hypothetical protein
MAHQSVAEAVAAVVALVLQVVVVALLLWLHPPACDQTVFHFQDPAHEVGLPLGSLVSPRRIVHAWSRRSLTERRWARWPRCRATMEQVWPSWRALPTWATHLWYSTSGRERRGISALICESSSSHSCMIWTEFIMADKCIEGLRCLHTVLCCTK